MRLQKSLLLPAAGVVCIVLVTLLLCHIYYLSCVPYKLVQPSPHLCIHSPHNTAVPPDQNLQATFATNTEANLEETFSTKTEENLEGTYSAKTLENFQETAFVSADVNSKFNCTRIFEITYI